MNDAAMAMRRVRYRLNRQGMVELDVWLAPLENALMHRPELSREIEQLLEREPPELLAMMHGEMTIPELLLPWLGAR